MKRSFFFNPVLGRLGSMKIIPVPPGHEHEPPELNATVDPVKGVVYVREADWPLIKAELDNLTQPGETRQ